MKYMLLIYGDWSEAPIGGPEQEAEMQAYFAFTEELVASGKMVAGDPLQGVDTATSVRVRDGKVQSTDGPFAETKEVLGGYYLVDADDLDDAIAWAAKIPGAAWGTVEVRPIVEFGGM